MAEPSGERPKIIIDEDWKSQVQAEKQRLAQQQQHEERPQQPRQQPAEDEQAALPPATLPVLFSTLASQALMCLGQIPHPITGKAEVHLDEAKHFIDLLQMLEEKTADNRTPAESEMLGDLLHELRLAYVTIAGRVSGNQPSENRPGERGASAP